MKTLFWNFQQILNGIEKRRQEWQFTGNILVATFFHLVALWLEATVNFAIYHSVAGIISVVNEPLQDTSNSECVKTQNFIRNNFLRKLSCYYKIFLLKIFTLKCKKPVKMALSVGNSNPWFWREWKEVKNKSFNYAWYTFLCYLNLLL